MNQFTLTKDEFIIRAMAGEVFLRGTHRLFYDATEINPFRYDIEALDTCWRLLDGKELFTLEQPKPRIERRWKYRIDLDGTTKETDKYFSDKAAKYAFESAKEWYKVENCFIDVEVRSNHGNF